MLLLPMRGSASPLAKAPKARGFMTGPIANSLDLPPSEWSRIDDILDDEGDYECRPRSTARKRLSASCVMADCGMISAGTHA